MGEKLLELQCSVAALQTIQNIYRFFYFLRFLYFVTVFEARLGA